MGARTPQEVFQHHAEALVAADLDGIVDDYSEGGHLHNAGGNQEGQGRYPRGIHATLV